MCEVLYDEIDSGFWDFNNSHSKNNKYGNNILSKFRYANFLYMEDKSKEFEISAMKTLLRTGEKGKFKNLERIIELVGKDKIESLLNNIINNSTNDLSELKKFRDALFTGNNLASIKEALKYAPNALDELERENPKDRTVRKGSYLCDDYVHIVSSSAFRRLQDKAQVYSLEEHDFVRSRLTHSNEVAANCELISSYIDLGNKFSAFDIENARLISRCSGLLHDIGNPPFGHYGEDLIKSFFIDKFREEPNYFHDKELQKDFTKFDGNAQAFRIATKLQYFGKKKSLNLPACILGSIIKYPFCSTYDFGKDKFGYFISEKEDIEWLKAFGVFQKFYRNPFALILEAADDISYITADLEDAIHKGLVSFMSFKRLKYEFKDPNDNSKAKEVCDNSKTKEFYSSLKSIYDEKIYKYLGIEKENTNQTPNSIERAKETIPSYVEQRIFEESMRPLIAKLRQDLIIECAKQFNKDYDKIFTNGVEIKKGLKYYELMDQLSDYKELIGELRKIVQTVYSSNEVSKTEVSGSIIINTILNEYYNAFTSICNIDYSKRVFEFDNKLIARRKYFEKIMTYVSNDFIENFFLEMEKVKKKSQNQEIEEDMKKFYLMHLLVDFVSGMTDSFANEIYRMLTNN